MRKRYLLICTIICAMLFTSCFDSLESITYSNGEYVITTRFTISKTTLEMATESDESGVTADSILKEMTDLFPSNASIEKVDTDTDFGISVTMKVKPNTKDENAKGFLPTISTDASYFQFNPIESDYFSNAEEGIANLMLASAKWRILISKKVMPTIKSAHLKYFLSGDKIYFPVVDLIDMYYIEIPFSLLILDDTPNYLFISKDEAEE